jgi:hypothetical protein
MLDINSVNQNPNTIILMTKLALDITQPPEYRAMGVSYLGNYVHYFTSGGHPGSSVADHDYLVFRRPVWAWGLSIRALTRLSRFGIKTHDDFINIDLISFRKEVGVGAAVIADVKARIFKLKANKLMFKALSKNDPDSVLNALKASATIIQSLIVDCEAQPKDGFSIKIHATDPIRSGRYSFDLSMTVDSAASSISHYELEPINA